MSSPNKRPRVEADLAAAVAAAAPSEDDAAEPPLHERKPESYTSARRALRLQFIRADGDESEEYEPEFVHQIFDEESIEYPSDAAPLAIKVRYSLATLDLCYEANVPIEGAAEAALYTLAGALPTPVADTTALRERASSAFAPEIAGECLVRECNARGGEDGGGVSPPCAIYCSTLAGAPPARLAFHERLQSLFRWAIETADPIDAADDRWRLFTMWRRCGDLMELVAACTVFRFQRWIPKEGPRPLLRVCQVVVLPPFRGQGHGSRLLQAIYDHAKAEGCLDVTVEDPNDAFRLVRDLTDLRSCLQASLMRPADMCSAPTPEQLAKARKVLPVTEDQLHRCFEVQQYQMLLDELARLRAAGATAHEEEAATKPFRLSLKKRINKANKEELDAMLSLQAVSADKDEGATLPSAEDAPSREQLVAARKARLEELYQEQISEYAECARRVAKKVC